MWLIGKTIDSTTLLVDTKGNLTYKIQHKPDVSTFEISAVTFAQDHMVVPLRDIDSYEGALNWISKVEQLSETARKWEQINATDPRLG